jgi:plastocyanin
MLSSIRITAVLIVFSLCVVFSSCKKEDPGTPGPNEVWLEYQLFRPSQIVVPAGTTIKFINKGNPSHTVQGSLFNSGLIRTDEVYEYTFTSTGTYYFTCGNHASVSSEQVAVVVQ